MPDSSEGLPNQAWQERQYILSPQDIEKQAREISDNQPEALSNLIYLYYLARHYLSFYEAQFNEFPDQVLNEYRNSLDHIMRCLGTSGGILTSDDKHNNLRKATAHMQRAVLDVCKYFAIGVQKEVKEFKISHSDKILILVADGNFYQDLIEKEKNANNTYANAKYKDSTLGENKEANASVLNNYIDSVSKFYELQEMCRENSSAIAQAKLQYSNIHKQGKALSGKFQIAIGLVIGGVMMAISFALGKFL